MGKAPGYYWYIGDWRRDPGIRRSSFVTRGVWREMLDWMSDSPTPGKLTGTAEEIRLLIGCGILEWQKAYDELMTLQICEIDVHKTTNNDGHETEILTFTNRRMARKSRERYLHSKRQLRYIQKKHKVKPDAKHDAKNDASFDGNQDAEMTASKTRPSFLFSIKDSYKESQISTSCGKPEEPKPKAPEEMTDTELEDYLKKSYPWVNYDYEIERYNFFVRSHPSFQNNRSKLIAHFNSIPKPVN